MKNEGPEVVLEYDSPDPWDHEKILAYGYTAWSPWIFRLFEKPIPRDAFLEFRRCHPEVRIIPWLNFSVLGNYELDKTKHNEVYDLHYRFYERAMGEGGWLARTMSGGLVQHTPDAPPRFGFSTIRFAENYGNYLINLIGRLRHAHLIDGVILKDIRSTPPRDERPCSAENQYCEIWKPRVTDLAWRHLVRLTLAKVGEAFGGNFIVSATGDPDAPKQLNGTRVEGIGDPDLCASNEAAFRRSPSFNTLTFRGDKRADIENSLALAAVYGHHLVVPSLLDIRSVWPDYFARGLGAARSPRIEEGGVVLRRFGYGWATFEPARGVGQVLWNRAA